MIQSPCQAPSPLHRPWVCTLPQAPDGRGAHSLRGFHQAQSKQRNWPLRALPAGPTLRAVTPPSLGRDAGQQHGALHRTLAFRSRRRSGPPSYAASLPCHLLAKAGIEQGPGGDVQMPRPQAGFSHRPEGSKEPRGMQSADSTPRPCTGDGAGNSPNAPQNLAPAEAGICSLYGCISLCTVPFTWPLVSV